MASVASLATARSSSDSLVGNLYSLRHTFLNFLST
jgi:hypothetical protein